MKIIINILSLLLIISIKLSAQFQFETNNYPIQLTSVSDIDFVSPNTGYVIGYLYGSSAKLIKTTNKGASWIQRKDFGNINDNNDYPKICFINANTGWAIFGYFLPEDMWTDYYEIHKTTDGGITWQLVHQRTFTQNEERIGGDIKFVNESTGYLINSYTENLIKTTNGGTNWETIKYKIESNYHFTNFVVSPSNPSKIYLGGYKYIANYVNYPLFLVSTDAGISFQTIYDGSASHDMNGINNLTIINNNNVDLVRFSSNVKLYKFNDNPQNPFTQISTLPIDFYDLSFSGLDKGFARPSNNPNIVYRTENQGLTWVAENLPTYNYASCGNLLVQFGNILYINGVPIITRKLGMNLYILNDNVNASGSFTFDGTNKEISSSPTMHYLRGGNSTLYTTPIVNNNQPNERIFYCWNNGNMNNIYNNFYFDNSGDIKASYKTKQKSTDETAIANVNQTKAVRGSNGSTYQIHSSIGGIFFTISSQPNLEFDREEVVNGGQLYSQQFPDANTADNNKNPSVNEIKYFDQENAAPSAFGLTAVWERYNQVDKTDILCALRSTVVDNPWTRFGNNLNELDGKLRSFSSSSGYDSKPEIYSLHMDGSKSDVRNFMVIVPHLEPSANENKLVVSARYKNYTCFDNEDPDSNPTNDFVIVNDNVSDYSVAFKPFLDGNTKSVYLYLTYKKNGNIYYRRELIYFSNYNEIIREVIPLEGQEINISSGDIPALRYTPDITLRNGMPTLTYQSKYDVYRVINFEGPTGVQNIQLHYYPIYIKMKDVSGNWLSYYYNSNGFQTQENPDIEGSTNYDAFLINYSKANSTFFQYVNISEFPRYYCNPRMFNGKDAKYIKGSYSGQFGSNSYPGLLTLSNQVNSLYDIGKQLFTINPYNIGTDGFSNLDGTIEKDNTQYSLTLGPIIASNTTFGFEDDTPPQTVHNPVEFNETMVSAVFSLSNNDTLIIGANGKYTSTGQSLQPLKYHVNLVNSNSGQIHRELFKDTINIEDSVGIEFLRGYVINNISNGTDQFYVQMVVDTVDAIATDFAMSGVYADNTPPEGDASNMNYKTKVFFENGSNQLSNFSNQLPKDYALSQNYPNPFNPSTTIKFALPKDGFVTMKVYDIAGREVARLISEVKKAGYHDVSFNALNLASGVYFYRIQSNDFVMTKRMVLIK